jgi:UDP-N-acetylglucosamine--N-acetylmuramyl-(pentapeptide) pyrophosphoryl-undecaprenol N-acetylglucosamine transferase
MRLLIAAGGTGGHIYPALAVATSIRRRLDGPELDWVGGRRGLEGQLVPAAGYRLDRLLLRSLRSVEVNLHLVLDPVRLILSVPQAMWWLVRRRPAAVFTTGGYVAIPVLVAARLLGIPSVLWEGNVIPGRSVRATARLASALAVSFGATCAALSARGPCFVTGTPIRDVASIDRLDARERLGLPASARLLVVFGGSQAVRRLNGAVAGALPRLVERLHVIHLTGADGLADAEAARAALPEDRRSRYRPVAFLGEGLLDALAAADLVVGRAGSSTLAETSAFGLPMVVVPYPYAGAHQRANAAELVDGGAALYVEDDAFDSAALLDAVGIVDDPVRHASMSAAARALAKPNAADAVAEVVVALAERRALPSAEQVAAIAADASSGAGAARGTRTAGTSAASDAR